MDLNANQHQPPTTSESHAFSVSAYMLILRLGSVTHGRMGGKKTIEIGSLWPWSVNPARVSGLRTSTCSSRFCKHKAESIPPLARTTLSCQKWSVFSRSARCLPHLWSNSDLLWEILGHLRQQEPDSVSISCNISRHSWWHRSQQLRWQLHIVSALGDR